MRGGRAARGYEVPQPAAPGELRGVKEPGAENPRARPPRRLGLLPTEGTVKATGPTPMAERGGGMVGGSCVSRFLGFGRRGGTRRLKLATTSGGEWRLRVGWAGGCVRRRKGLRRCGGLTPCACIGIIDGWVNVAEVHFAHEAINLCKGVSGVIWTAGKGDER